MTSLIVLLLIIVVVVAIFWFMRHQGTRGHRQRRGRHAAHKLPGQAAPVSPGGLDKLQASGMFWGVEIGQPGCEAAHELLGRKYPFAEAPELPLAGCSSAICTCQFKGLKERRSQHRRTHIDRRSEIRFEEGKTEQRSPKDRRRSDSWNDHSY